MDLNQTTLRGILATILSVDQRYVVPKQGNWWNPQDTILPQPATWCGYVIRNNAVVTAPYYRKDVICVNRVAIVDLQFVGDRAEEIACSVAFWPNRADVARALSGIGGAMLYTDMDARSTSFWQEGTNAVLAWNVSVRINWIQEMDTGLEVLVDAETSGSLITQPENIEIYTGTSIVVPTHDEQVLDTEYKLVPEDIVVEPIPVSEVTDAAGGTTITI